jgi:regulator of RNase E activity RraB
MCALPAMILLTYSGCSQRPEENNEQNTMPSGPEAAVDNSDKWDFYLCKVDDAAASIMLDFKYRDHGRVVSAHTLYWCQIAMLEPGDHGMGIGNDAKALNKIEDEIVEKAKDDGFYYVGRLRNHGRWQLVFYGADDLDSALRIIVANIITDPSEREYIIDSKLDAEWSYYFEFLCPDAERWQWIMDRRVIESLESEGDPLTQSRRVDHWTYFDNAETRSKFIDAALKQGFELERTTDDSPGAHTFSAQIFRVDSVQLEDIHNIVMSLKTIADEVGGEYDGWETFVERP